MCAYEKFSGRSSTPVSSLSSTSSVSSISSRNISRFYPGCAPPAPPLQLTPRVATDSQTPLEILWYIARNHPQLRFWLIANPASTPELLEYVSQAGGPLVKESFELLFTAHDFEPGIYATHSSHPSRLSRVEDTS